MSPLRFTYLQLTVNTKKYSLLYRDYLNQLLTTKILDNVILSGLLQGCICKAENWSAVPIVRGQFDNAADASHAEVQIPLKCLKAPTALLYT
jgi:hypothetical protein